jgi:rubrerythrin
METTIEFTPKIFTVAFDGFHGIAKWNLLTINGESPNNTVYFLHKNDKPSSLDVDKILELIEKEEWTEKVVAEDTVLDYSIDKSIFTIEGYSKIYEKLTNLGF